MHRRNANACRDGVVAEKDEVTIKIGVCYQNPTKERGAFFVGWPSILKGDLWMPFFLLTRFLLEVPTILGHASSDHSTL